MADETQKSGGGLGALKGPLGFVLVLAIWTGVNQWRLRANVKSDCMEVSLGVPSAEQTEFCGCMASEAAKRFPILATVPLVGRIMSPSDEEQGQIGLEASEVCAAKMMAS